MTSRCDSQNQMKGHIWGNDDIFIFSFFFLEHFCKQTCHHHDTQSLSLTRRWWNSPSNWFKIIPFGWMELCVIVFYGIGVRFILFYFFVTFHLAIGDTVDTSPNQTTHTHIYSHFNRSMRLWARKNGYSLSDKSLVKRIDEIDKGDPIPVRSEEDIFRLLGLKYMSPQERDICNSTCGR